MVLIVRSCCLRVEKSRVCDVLEHDVKHNNSKFKVKQQWYNKEMMKKRVIIWIYENLDVTI